jgi:putative phage-type endonuclease
MSNFNYINDLDSLTNILDTLVFEDEPSIFTDEYAVDLVQTALHLMDDFILDNPQIISETDFHEILLEEIKDIFYIQMEEQIEESDDPEQVEDDMNELLEDAFQIFITLFYPERSINTNDYKVIELNDDEIHFLEKKIQGLRDIPQPVQRTPEWYEFRSNLITASNAWKAFESQSAINQLIYEKCQPIKVVDPDVKIINNVNTNTPMHHGQKYEPLSVMFYEDNYNTKVEDFGCIKHPSYAFLGASPDGINVDPLSERFGRMLEIKNPVSRNITGIPKKEYWVQMQLQMEVCDLDECDFLETKFVEYPDRKSYEQDINCKKGIIIQFYTKEGLPFYAYKPLHLEEVSEWEDETITLYESEPYQYSFTKYIYWKLEQLSCVLVLRNREWFKNNIGQLGNVWTIVEKERVTGYDHRAPKTTLSTFKKGSAELRAKFETIGKDTLRAELRAKEEVNFFNFIKNKEK